MKNSKEVEAWKNRASAGELGSYRWIKNTSSDELDAALAKVQDADFILKPFNHQKAAFLVARERPHFLFLYDMGTGKTKIMLDLLRWRRKRGVFKRALFLVPKSVNLLGILADSKTHAPDLRMIGITKDMPPDRKRAILRSGHFDVCVMTYAGFVRYMMLPKSKRPKRAFKSSQDGDVDREAMRELFGGIDYLIMDECQHVGNHQTLIYRALKALAEQCKFRYGLSGTPFDSAPHDLWSQFRVIDGGETLGRNLAMFRAAFFRRVEDAFSVKHVFRESLTDLLRRTIEHRALTWKIDECFDLPPVTFVVRDVEFSADAWRQYCLEGDKLLKVQKGKIDASLVKAPFIKMRQLSSGFIKLVDEDDPDDKGQYIDFPPGGRNEKIEALMELLSEIPADEKVVVSHEFIHSGDLIEKALSDAKIRHVRVGKSHNPLAEFERPKTRVLLGNHHAMGEGLNLQIARFMIRYELPVSAKLEKQLNARIHRPGQTKPKFIYTLCSQNSVDHRILGALKRKANLMEELLHGAPLV